jgi:hypothetical protein
MVILDIETSRAKYFGFIYFILFGKLSLPSKEGIKLILKIYFL